MAWTKLQLRKLRGTLAALYPREVDQRRILSDADVSIVRIAFDPSAINSWHAILTEANGQGCVDNLLGVALEDYPGNELLLRAKEATPPGAIEGPPLHSRDQVSSRDDDPVTSEAVLQSEPPAEAPRGLEKIISHPSDLLLPISFLEVGVRAARSVAMVRLADYSLASGFLIDGNRLLTPHHVIPDIDVARTAVAVFDYQLDEKGFSIQPVELALEPDRFFVTSMEDDWTAVAVTGDPNANWGALELRNTSILPGGQIHLIQHPGGGPKRISLGGTCIYVGASRVQYLTNTMPGSSGAPVFDNEWNVVALHNSGGWMHEPGGSQDLYRNEGIRIGVILAALPRS